VCPPKFKYRVDVLRKSTLPDELIFMYRVLHIALPMLFFKPMYRAFVYALKNRICGMSTDMFGIVRVKTSLCLLCPKGVNEFSPFKRIQSQRLFQ